MGSIQDKKLYIFLVLVDVLGISAVFLLAYSLRFGLGHWPANLSLAFEPQFLGLLGGIVLSNFVFDLYETRYWINPIFSPLRIGLSVIVTLILVVLWVYVLDEERANFIGRGVLAGGLAGTFVFSLVFRWLVQWWSKARIQGFRWVFIGGKTFKNAFEKECAATGCFLNYEWFLSDEVDVFKKVQEVLHGAPLRGIVVCEAVKGPLADLLMSARLKGLRIYDFQYFFERVWGKVLVNFLSPTWFIFNSGFAVLHERTTAKFKGFADFFGALLLIILTFPVVLVVSIMIRLESRGSPFFFQTRVGLNGKTFLMYKLRSMYIDAEAKGAQWTQKGDTRITKVGSFIRLTRIDELPQLLNILKGDMSFIGPRPERPEFTAELEKKIPFYQQRNLVKPGLTGWAQVVYSYGASDEDALQKLQYELFYIKNQSVWLDLLILFKTFVVVLFGKGR